MITAEPVVDGIDARLKVRQVNRYRIAKIGIICTQNKRKATGKNYTRSMSSVYA